MNNPHVEALYYRFLSENPNDDFNTTREFTTKLGNFEVLLKNNELIAKPLEHYPDEQSAIESLEPYLHTWEDSAFLDQSHFRIRFIFKHSKIIDLNPDPNSLEIRLGPLELLFTAETISVHRSIDSYPHPLTNYSSSQLTDELIYRLKSYIDGREYITTAAYAILNRLESNFSNGDRRKQVAVWLNFENNVLDKLGNLCNKKDKEIGRHMGRANEPLTASEIEWIKEVTFRLVQRVGEINVSAGTNLPTLRMSNFHPLRSNNNQ